MGGDLRAAPEGRVTDFLVAALKDPFSGNLDRIQIVKGWLDRTVNARRKSTTWSGPATARPARTASCLPSAARWMWPRPPGPTPSAAPELITVWKDPDFDPSRRLLLCPRARDPDTALDRLRRSATSEPMPDQDADDYPGARLYLPHLVHDLSRSTRGHKRAMPANRKEPESAPFWFQSIRSPAWRPPTLDPGH